jgi:hypothetical protein
MKLLFISLLAIASCLSGAYARKHCACSDGTTTFISFTDTAATCSNKCTLSSVSSSTIDPYYLAYNQAQYKLLNHTVECETSLTNPALKANFLGCWDYLTYFAKTTLGADYFYYGAYLPPLNTKCLIELYQDLGGASGQTKPTKVLKNGQSGFKIVKSDGCVREYLLIGGKDELLNTEAVLGLLSIAKRVSMSGTNCPAEGSAVEVCTQEYALRELGSEGGKMTIFPTAKTAGYDCYTQFCNLNSDNTRCDGEDKILDIQFDITVNTEKTNIVVTNPACAATYAITKGEALGVKPALGLDQDGAAPLFTSFNLLLIALFSIASIAF